MRGFFCAAGSVSETGPGQVGVPEGEDLVLQEQIGDGTHGQEGAEGNPGLAARPCRIIAAMPTRLPVSELKRTT